jgi:hypothetical protein
MKITMSIDVGILIFHVSTKRLNVSPPPKGRKVMYIGKNGHKFQHEKSPFKKGDILTIKEIYVDKYFSTVEFIEFSNKRFNTVMFDDIK